MPQATIFDVDGTLLDSVDLHARAWQEALVKFGHQVTFEQARSQISVRETPPHYYPALRANERPERWGAEAPKCQ
jgi:beta-phosphoglucomutase-like phosphatase (HAD superfamily)